MLRLALVADSHFFELSRFEECQRLHHWIANDARTRGCNAWAHSGDIYERKSTPREREAVAQWAQEMSALGPGVLVRGNHDAVEDLPLLERLELRHPLRVIERAEVVLLGGAAFACLGWPQRANVAAMLPDHSKEEVEQAAGDALRHVLLGLGEAMREHEEKPRLFLGHVMVRGSQTSTGQPLVGCDFELGLDDLALARCDAYLLGHIHKGQHWEVEGAPVVYPGSPRRTAFGELEPKGYVVVECDDHGVRWEFVEAPATPMVQLEGLWEGPDLAFCRNVPAGDFEHGAEIRLRYETAADQREAARAAAEKVRDVLLARGALSVKLEEVVCVETRARSPEVAEARTLVDKLEALWRQQHFDPGARRESLLAKVNAVEEEARTHAA